MIVIDSSVILASLFDEPLAYWSSAQMQNYGGELIMSTVNLTEVLMRVRTNRPTVADQIEIRLLASDINFIAPDVAQSRIAALARLTFKINLGDCFVYALAKTHNCPILTLDTDFRKVDCPVILP